jgi:outer membrane murein-binding lipoprotein Lpp
VSRRTANGRRRRLAPALAVSFALMAVLILAGCGPATPVDETSSSVDETSSSVDETSSPVGTSAAQEGSGTTATESDSTARAEVDASTGLDQEAAAAIENSVSEAESLLQDLDSEFQQDAAETN